MKGVLQTCVLRPASETHRQLADEQLVAMGIEQGLVRLFVGLENVCEGGHYCGSGTGIF